MLVNKQTYLGKHHHQKIFNHTNNLNKTLILSCSSFDSVFLAYVASFVFKSGLSKTVEILDLLAILRLFLHQLFQL